jgi:regulator of sigma E protease
MSVVVIIILFVVALFVAMCLHELGHFITAKRTGVKVEEFGIGMPPPRLFGFKRGETTYSLNAIPIGAFVKAAGENDPSVPRSLAGKGPWTRLGIYAAGPVMNIFLAFVLLSAFLALPVSVFAGDGLMVGAVVGNSPAEQAGIEPGDIILQVDGQPIDTQGDMQDIVNSVAEGTQISLLLLRNGQDIRATATPQLEQGQRVVGVYIYWNMVSQIQEGSSAYDAGVRAGDYIRGINGQAVYDASSMINALSSVAQDGTISLVVQRDGNVTTPTFANDGYSTLPGVQMQYAPGAHIGQDQIPVWQAVNAGAKYIIEMPVLIVRTIPQIIKTPSNALVGPIGAGQLTVEVVRTSGSSALLFMAGMISLGLAVFNFLPIPPLDGGGMLVAFIEGVRRGKRLSPRTMRLAYTIGTAFLIALVVLITSVDIWRLPRGFGL